LVKKSAGASSLRALERTKAAIAAGLITSIPISNSEALNKYIRNVGAMNRRTAYEYYHR
jgi:hypothetical protein